MVLGFTLSKSKSRSITKTQQSIQGGMKKIPSRKLKKFFKIPVGESKMYFFSSTENFIISMKKDILKSCF